MKAAFIAFAALIVAVIYYQFFYPPNVMKRQVEASLAAFSAAVESQDRAKISVTLQDMLTESAHVHLEVTMVSLTQEMGKPAVQDFGKAEFIPFIDNVLFPMTDYHYEAELESFALGTDKKSANVSFTSKQYGDGTSYYAGTAVAMRESAEAECTGQVVFERKQALLNDVNCALNLRLVPKPGEAGKLTAHPEALGQYLR